MSFFSLCSTDPLINTLRGVFSANIIRIPEERIKPLCILAGKKNQTKFIDHIDTLLKTSSKNDNALNNIQILVSEMSDISGKKSTKINLDLGLKLLDSFFKGFGIESCAIKSSFENVLEVSFCFKNVQRLYISMGNLSKIFINKKIDTANPLSSIFFGENKHDFLLIDSVIQSSDFSISVEKATSSDFKLDIPVISQMIANANSEVSVASNTGLDLIFKGKKHLSFAFTCLKFEPDENGKIRLMMPDSSGKILFSGDDSEELIDFEIEKHLIHDIPGMITLE